MQVLLKKRALAFFGAGEWHCWATAAPAAKLATKSLRHAIFAAAVAAAAAAAAGAPDAAATAACSNCLAADQRRSSSGGAAGAYSEYHYGFDPARPGYHYTRPYGWQNDPVPYWDAATGLCVSLRARCVSLRSVAVHCTT
jgi:hypothetical protein